MNRKEIKHFFLNDQKKITTDQTDEKISCIMIRVLKLKI